LLDEALPAPESSGGLAYGALVRLHDVLGMPDHLDPPPSSSVGGLDRDRKSMLPDEALLLGGVLDRLLGARYQGRPDALRELARRHYVAQDTDGGGRRADPQQPGVDDRFGELGDLEKEAITGVHGIRSMGTSGLQDLLRDEVALLSG